MQPKNITTGEGGIVTTDDDEIAMELRTLRSHGMANRDEHVTLGYNYRMSDLNGAIGTAQVDRLDSFNERRRGSVNASRPNSVISTGSNPQQYATTSTMHTFGPHLKFREDEIGLTGKEVWAELRESGVETRHRYNVPLYDQPVFADHRGVQLGVSLECQSQRPRLRSIAAERRGSSAT